MPLTITKEIAEALAPRFFSKVDRSGDCWLWTAGKFRRGYGMWTIRVAKGQRYTIQAHRLSYVLHNGPIPPGLEVMHKCDTPGCVNPDHLTVGTHAENLADMVRKGRSVSFKGEAHHNAKLSEEDVVAIRGLARDGHLTQREIGERFGVSAETVRHIHSRRCWSHVP